MADLDLLSAYAFGADMTGFAHRQRLTPFMPESRYPGTEAPAGGITFVSPRGHLGGQDIARRGAIAPGAVM